MGQKRCEPLAVALRISILALLVLCVAGSRFRYGTIFWEQNNVREPTTDGKQWVTFYLRTQYRRSFLWGTAFKEQWAFGAEGTTAADPDDELSWYGSEFSYLDNRSARGLYRSGTCPAGANDGSDFTTFNQCFRCPNGDGGTVVGTSVESAANFTANWGCSPTDAFPTAMPSVDTYNFFVKFPPKMQELNPSEPVRVCPTPFHCDEKNVLETDADNDGYFDVIFTTDDSTVAGNDLCDPNKYEDDATWTTAGSPCAPWHEVYGFYTGATLSDGIEPDRANYNAEVTMRAVDYDKCYKWTSSGLRPTSCKEPGYRNLAVGDYLTLEGEVDVEYWLQSGNESPYIAFFTGGDRVYGCAYAQNNPSEFPGLNAVGGCPASTNEYGLPQPNGLLRNNEEGRFRLETSVYLAAGDSNKSPVSMMPPLIVMQAQAQGVPVRFHVPAFDPDDDALQFRLGNYMEFGGVKRGLQNAFPWEEIFNGLDAINETGAGTSGAVGYDTDPTSPTRGMLLPLPRTDVPFPRSRQRGNFGCSFYDFSVLANGICSDDRVAGPPPGSAITTDGLVEWHTWTQGNGSVCSDSGAGGCSRLETGLYNFVVMIEEVSPSGAGRIKVPVDFLVYLYDTGVSFCGDGCAVPINAGASIAGLPTFADRDGIYGTAMNGTSSSRVCTICSYQGQTQPCNASDVLLPASCSCNVNNPPRFYQSPLKEYQNLRETPLLEEWEAYSAAGATGQLPYLNFYRGEDVEFYVAGIDEDDCAEVYVEATSLPGAPGSQALVSEAIYETQFPSGSSSASGTLVRKKFSWSANLASGESYLNDPRPSTSIACFTVSDKYLYHSPLDGTNTLRPYCIEIRLEPPPTNLEQTLFRWDWDQTGTCSEAKLGISFHPALGRFVLVDQGTRYHTACKFEQYMWHHVFATVSDDRVGRLYVDGELQELLREVGLDPTDPQAYDQGIAVGTTVAIQGYVNKCKQAAPLAPYWWTCGLGDNPECPRHLHAYGDRRRRLQGILDPYTVDGTFSLSSDYPVADGLLQDYNTTLEYVTDPGLAAPTGACCGFIMATGCNGESNTFDGFLDEVVVYNREVSGEDIKGIMFKMPQYLPRRELEAPRGVQHDLAAGRVLWARFNNPCMEGPEQPGITVAPPEEAGGGRRRLSQITSPSFTRYGLLNTDDEGGRREGVSDKAGMSSGGAIGDSATGPVQYIIVDFDTDRTNFTAFRSSAKYVYTGVPWLAPSISRVEVDGVRVNTSNPLPLDGNLDVTISGVGFARSPWLKCVSVQPDVRAEYEAKVLAAAKAYEARVLTDPDLYDNYFKTGDGLQSMMVESAPWTYEKLESGFQMATASPILEPNEWAPWLFTSSKKHPQNKGRNAYSPSCSLPSIDPLEACPDYTSVSTWRNAPSCFFCPDDGAVRNDWSLGSVRNPAVPPYESILSRAALSLNPETEKYVYTLFEDFIYGGWEKVTCSAPAGSFPSDMYYLGVSNDGGLTGSPAGGADAVEAAATVTYTEYALELDGEHYLEMTDDVPRGRTFSAWFMPKDITGFQMLMNLTGGIGVGLNGGELFAYSSDGETEYPASGETGAIVTSGEWHNIALILSGSSGSTLKLYLDGVELLSDGTVVLGNDNPKLEVLGFGFMGYVDEVKVLVPARDGSASELEALMWDRERPLPNRNDLKLYLRFNAPIDSVDSSNTQRALLDISGNSAATACRVTSDSTDPIMCTFLPVPAPWEPASVYEINGKGPSVTSVPMTGGTELEVRGFNFAPSPWLRCGWGRDLVEVYSRTFSPTRTVNPTDTCPYQVGSLNSVDGKPPQLTPYSVYRFDNDTATYSEATLAGGDGFSRWADDYDATMALDCASPLIDPDVYYMSVAGRKFVNTFPFEVTDVSLHCDGRSTWLSAPPQQSTSLISTSTQGYTFSAWVMPFSRPVEEEVDPRSVASDKLGHRRTYLPNEKPEQTIFAMENPTGDVKHAGALMYDGVRFFYYDDCILDVTSTLDTGSRPDEWHYVSVSVDSEGEGDLYVDGRMIEHFTTVCKPDADSSFSICMDEDANGEPSAHFNGLLDEVKVINQALGQEDLLKYMFRQRAHAELSRNLMYYDFDTCEPGNATVPAVFPPSQLQDQFNVLRDIGPALTIYGDAPCGGPPLQVGSATPWRPARLMAQGDVMGGVTGRHRLRVVGANLAVSQFLGVTFNSTFVPAVEMESPNVMIVETPEVEGESVFLESLSNWAGASEIGAQTDDILPDDTLMVSLSGSVQDLATGLMAYYTFDAVPTGGPAEVTDGLTIPDADRLYDLSGEGRHGAVETGLSVPDRDGYEAGALLIDGSAAVAYLPAPALYMNATEYSIVLWAQMSFAPTQASNSLPRNLAPLTGAWKMYSLVRQADGSFQLYINSEPTGDEELRTLMAQALDNFLETGIVLFGLPVATAVDDLWVYDRALSATEVRARYFTNSLAVDFGKPALATGFGAPATYSPDPSSPNYAPPFMWPRLDPRGNGTAMLGNMNGPPAAAPVVITDLHVPTLAPTFSAWIYPWTTDSNTPTTILADKDGMWSFGLRGERLSFYIHTDCPCEPCSQFREVVSWKARVLPGRWSHVAVRYDVIETSIDGNILHMYVDGVLLDKKAFSEYGRVNITYSGTASVGAEWDGSARFNGLIYSVSIAPDFVPWMVKREVQCPQRDPDAFVLNMGGAKAASFGSDDVFVMGVAPRAGGAMLVGALPAVSYVNATYDDPTVADAITITGTDARTKTGGYDGDYIITARTTCGKKRVHGGDDMSVAMTFLSDPSVDTSSAISVTDHMDGNYHVTYSGLQCGTYFTNLTMDDMEVMAFNTVIAPGPTDPANSELLTTQTGNCMGPFGVVHTLRIQARDMAGCSQTSGTDIITVSLRGPADINVTATYVGDGVYEALFVPPAHGKYFVEIMLSNAMYLDPVPFTSTPYVCIDICRGHSISLDNTGAVETTPSTTALIDAAHSTGAITIEAWLLPSSTFARDAHLFYKGSLAELEAGSFTKGYSLTVSADLSLMTASIYVGLGVEVTLQAEVDLPPETWTHLAVTYDGSVLIAYKNAEVVGETTPQPDPLPVHHNTYGHPLMMGRGVVGQLDEATVWSRALTADEVAERMHCPKFLTLEDVLVYMPFNDEPGSVAFAAFGGPAPNGTFPWTPYAAPAAVVATADGTVTLEPGTPSDDATRGVGVPGSVYSIVTPGDEVVAGNFESVVLNLAAYDECGFHYIGTGAGDFELELTPYSLEYYTELDPIADGVPMYPIISPLLPLGSVSATGLPGTCVGSATPAPPFYRGDMYNMLGNAVDAGMYFAKVSTVDGHVIAEEVEVVVVARLGDLSEVIIEAVPDTEAGVSAAVRFNLQDGFDNVIMDDHSSDIVVSVFETASETPASYISAPWFDATNGEYLVSFLAATPVQYTVSVTVTSVSKTAARTLNKNRPTWRELLTANGAVPEQVRRFEAGATADPSTGDIYLWGGASADKGYVNDAWVLRGADPAIDSPMPTTVLAYKRTVAVASAEDVPDDSVVEVTVNTAALIAAGKMHHGCRDIYFTLPSNGAYLYYYVDSFASRGCGTANTIVYLSIPGGTIMAGVDLEVEMYYGSPGHYWPNDYSDPSRVFAFYEGFEDGTAGAFAPVEPCTMEPASGEDGFVVEEFEESYAGSYALHAPVGVRAVMAAPAAAPLDAFLLRAWFWDSNAHEAAHFISPDYGGCGTTAGADTLLPAGGPLNARSTAVGAYTLSHPTKYAVSSPWQSSGLDKRRSAQWHRLEVMSTPEGGLTVMVNGDVIKAADAITLDKVLLSSGYSADGEGHAFLANAHAYFDEISVVPIRTCAAGEGADCVSATVQGVEHGVVKYVASKGWEAVPVGDAPAPPARFSFTMATHSSGAIMFGGERSSYAFNDVWRFDFATEAWVYMPPKSNTAPPPRFDHSAAVMGDTMWVYGGRTGAGEVLSDVWSLDLTTSVWTRLAESTPMGARFGHAAVFSGSSSSDAMYVYGGYIPGTGFSSEFFTCVLVPTGALECSDISDGCPDVATPAAARVSGVGLTPRTGHAMVPSATGLLLFGGSDDTDLEPTGVYSFVPATCRWSRTNIAAGESQGGDRVVSDIARHDHAAVKLTAWMAVQGGVTAGGFESSTYVLAAP